MDDAQLGSAIRAVRIRAERTQADVAKAAFVRRYDVSCVEQGKFSGMSLSEVRRIASSLGMWVELKPNWRGVNLEHLVNGAHTALQEAVLSYLDGRAGWIAHPEVTFSIFGERGAIDILAWHAATRTVLIIELKTLVVDPADLVKQMGRRLRLATEIAATQGWRARDAATWVIFTDTHTNRRQVARRRTLLQGLAGLDGRTVRSWLQAPSGPMSALSFWAEPQAVIRQQVRRRPSADTNEPDKRDG
ncbi:MAG: hypothetical protein KF809_15490 [Chloroflexi bacterium]|nr:hypothetical protein [Chloroflexota bacterium]